MPAEHIDIKKRKFFGHKALSAERSPADIRYSASITKNIDELLSRVRKLSLEGLIGKRAGSKYDSKRSGTWIKIKLYRQGSFVIGGDTQPGGERKYMGALLVGLHELVKLKRKARTGFNPKWCEKLYRAANQHQEICSSFDWASDRSLRANLWPAIGASNCFWKASARDPELSVVAQSVNNLAVLYHRSNGNGGAAFSTSAGDSRKGPRPEALPTWPGASTV